MKTMVLLVPVFAFIGCTSVPTGVDRLGHFTVASSYNVRNLGYSKASKNTVEVHGKNCYQLRKETPADARLQRAMDDAIHQGQEQGLDGDLLVNVRIDHEVYSEPYLYIFKKYYDCVTVSGELVRLGGKK